MVDWEIIKRNQTAKIKPTKVQKIRKPFLSKEAFQTLLDLCQPNSLVGARTQAML